MLRIIIPFILLSLNIYAQNETPYPDSLIIAKASFTTFSDLSHNEDSSPIPLYAEKSESNPSPFIEQLNAITAQNKSIEKSIKKESRKIRKMLEAHASNRPFSDSLLLSYIVGLEKKCEKIEQHLNSLDLKIEAQNEAALLKKQREEINSNKEAFNISDWIIVAIISLSIICFLLLISKSRFDFVNRFFTKYFQGV